MLLPKKDEKVIVVMPAYNAAQTLEKTVGDIPEGSVDEIILVDDASTDETAEKAKKLGLITHVHKKNKGYGGNQKSCYKIALERNADYVVMVHPDDQYDSRLVPVAVEILRLGICDVVLGCRIRTLKESVEGGMPLYKYIGNRFLTIIENIILRQNLGEFHSGFRAYKKEVLEKIPFENNSDDFVFDSQFMVQVAYFGFKSGDVPISVRYFKEASSISFTRSVKYGLGTLSALLIFILQKLKLIRSPLFEDRK